MKRKLIDDNILKSLEKLHFKVKKKSLGKNQGPHSSLKKGSGIEFSDFRIYSLGDNPKNIDWNVYAKTEKLYLKEFKEYQNINFFIYLDVSASMDTPKENSKLETALKLASSLSYISLINNENLTIAASNNFFLNKLSNKKQFNLILEKLSDITPTSDDFFNDNLSLYLSTLKFPGIAVCISDFLTPFENIKLGLDKIISKNFETHLIKITDPNFKDYFNGKNARFIDSETKEEKMISFDNNILQDYFKNYNNHIEKIKTYAKIHDVMFYTLNIGDDIITFLNEKGLCR
ncbi:MAG: DUF58 domain-containing protein [Bdellovibrionota bacterium]